MARRSALANEADSRRRARAGARVPVRLTSELEAPAVTGVFNPVILVPEGSTLWSDDMKYATIVSGKRPRRPPDRASKVLLEAALPAGLLAIAGTTPAVPGGAPTPD